VLLGLAIALSLPEPVSRWSKIYCEAMSGSQQRLVAERAIRRIGTNALPSALRWIQEEVIEDEDGKLQPADFAFAIFQILGPAATSAIPSLVEIANLHWESSGRAVAALASIGPSALPALVGLAQTPKKPVRYYAVVSIGTLGTNAIPAVPALKACLDDPDPRMAMSAFQVLIKLNLKSQALLPAFTNKLNDPRPFMRTRAIKAIADYGSAARPAISSLTAMLSDENSRVRFLATNAIHRMQPDFNTK
jgi:HEAT repeat protein